MKKSTMVMAVVVAVMLLGSTAWAWNWDDHVKVAPNGKGDALIFPFYAALNGGWESRIWVINTALDRSVVAKLVVRSRINSEELRDFFLYLTPGDAWNGIIRMGSNGQPEFVSTDDSVVVTAPTATTEAVFATTAKPFTTTIEMPRCADDTNQIGYVEVFESVHSTLNGTGIPNRSSAARVSLNVAPVPKTALYNEYETIAPRLARTLAATVAGGNTNLVTDGINVLTGFMEFRNLAQNQNSALQAKVLRDYDATLNGANWVAGGIGGPPLILAGETYFGVPTQSNNSIGEVEAALSGNNFALPYSNSTLSAHIVTFPTKLTVLGATGTTTMCTTGRTTRSPYFTKYGQCVTYTASVIDMSENVRQGSVIVSPYREGSEFCGEVNLVTNFAFPEGWVNYAFGGTTDFDPMGLVATVAMDGNYTDVPAIATSLNLGSTNDGYWLLQDGHTDGRVQDIVNLVAGTTNPTIYHYYQYQDESNKGYLYDIDLPNANTAVGTTVNENQSRGASDGHRPLNN